MWLVEPLDVFTVSASSLFYPASLIRGNRANCALFCDNLDWLVSKLDRLEASSGEQTPCCFVNLRWWSHRHRIPSRAGILEVLYCVLIESPEVLNIIQENHIKSIISLLDKHGRNHKVRTNSNTQRITKNKLKNMEHF